MATISTALRHFKEPTKEQLTHIFFSIPPVIEGTQPVGEDVEEMEINAVLSLGEAVEDSYVSTTICVVLSILRARPGWKAAYHLSFPGVRISRQKVCPVHDTTIDHSKSRTAQCQSWDLCTESPDMAWIEARGAAHVPSPHC